MYNTASTYFSCVLLKAMFLLFRQLFVWFIGAISLCGVSLLANMVLIFLQCNRATRPGRSTQRPRLEETAFLFSPEEEEL